MQIVLQGAYYQYNAYSKEVSKWHQDRGAWITLPEFRKYHPFNIDDNNFPQPYLDETQQIYVNLIGERNVVMLMVVFNMFANNNNFIYLFLI